MVIPMGLHQFQINTVVLPHLYKYKQNQRISMYIRKINLWDKKRKKYYVGYYAYQSKRKGNKVLKTYLGKVSEEMYLAYKKQREERWKNVGDADGSDT